MKSALASDFGLKARPFCSQAWPYLHNDYEHNPIKACEASSTFSRFLVKPPKTENPCEAELLVGKVNENQECRT